MLTLTVDTQLYFLFIYTGVYNNDMFRPCMWAIMRLWLELQLRLYSDTSVNEDNSFRNHIR